MVTGGAGFIGSTLVRKLLQIDGARVLCYDALTYAGLRESLPQDSGLKLVKADVADPSALRSAIDDFRPDTLMHLAAESHVDRSITEPEPFVRTNVQGTAVALMQWRAYQDRLEAEGDGLCDRLRFLHVSTDEVFGPQPAETVASERSAYAPSSPYSASKAAADHFVLAFRRTYGVRSVIVFPTNNYGPRQFPEKLIPLVAMRAVAGDPIPLYGDGMQVRDWLHVEDCCSGLIAAATLGPDGESYCLGGGAEEWSNQRIVEEICDIIDEASPVTSPRRGLIRHVEDRPGHDRRYALDSGKALSRLNWSPRIGLSDGLGQTVRWCLENPGWMQAASARG